MLRSSGSTIGGLLGLALFLVTLWEFFRGMRALGEIATRLERIERILEGGSVVVDAVSNDVFGHGVSLLLLYSLLSFTG